MQKFLFLAIAVGTLVLFGAPSASNVFAQQIDLSRAIEAQEKHTPALLNTPGIVGTGVGISGQGLPVVRIYIQTPGVGAPPELDSIPVERVVTGRFEARCYQGECSRPVPLGVSTGHPQVTAGTVGARVKDAAGNVYALSNNHVLANSNNAAIGDSALQPGPYDGGTDPADKIGSLAAFQPINFSGGDNQVDAAIAISTSANLSNVTFSGYKPTSNLVEGSIGLYVKKDGRSTGLTTGQISEVNVTVTICYEPRGPFMCAKSARFVNQLAIGGGSFSAGGDSGSLIVTQSGNDPVGLLFAGSSTRTIANRIQPVLAHFNVQIDDSTDTGPAPDDEDPTSPVLISATAISSSQIDLDWAPSTDNVGVSGYKVYREGEHVATVPASQTAYSDTSLTASTPYDYYVTAVDAATNESGPSNVLSATTLDPPLAPLSLSVSGYKVKGVQQVDLTWRGAAATNVDIFRDGTKLVTTSNDGFHTDAIGKKGGGSYTYKVCEAGTNTCSANVTVTF